MRLKKALQKLTAVMLIISLAVTCYATDIDSIFNIRASAASYEDRATSMLQFYKEGSKLDKKSISSDELYVFGVFVSNFLMPFQSNVGYMSSDSFVTKMAQTFFGDAYTAQQYSDMKYTLGLVQSAQNSRKKLICVENGSGCSFDTIYRNFGGFYAPTQEVKEGSPGSLNAGTLTYTYEGIEDHVSDHIVWQTGTDVFDAVIGQLISICPSQAGVYMGTPGKTTSSLYVDCFGNISDTEGTVVVPACMNPYAFYNKYLNYDRVAQTSSANSTCPIQLPINNAFWMGTMLTPQELTSRVQVTASQESGFGSSETYYLQVEYGGEGVHNQLQEGKLNLDTAIKGEVDADGWGTVFLMPLTVAGTQTVAKTDITDYNMNLPSVTCSSDTCTSTHYYPDGSYFVPKIIDNTGTFEWADPDSFNVFADGYFSQRDTDDKSFESKADYLKIPTGANKGPFGYNKYFVDDYGVIVGYEVPSSSHPTTVIAGTKTNNVVYAPSKLGYLITCTLGGAGGIIKHFTECSSNGGAEIIYTSWGTTNYLCVHRDDWKEDPDTISAGQHKDNILADIKRLGTGGILDNNFYNHDDGVWGALYGDWRFTLVKSSDGGKTVKALDGAGSVEAQTTLALQRTLISLPDLYIPVSTWTDSTTALVGISTMDGSELGIYFDPAIQKNFLEAWKVKTGNTDVDIGTLTEDYLVQGTDGYIDTWNFVGGTSVPINQVLDDIALFDTYNNFSESLMETIRPISMYTDTDGVWHAEKANGTKVQSVMASIQDITIGVLNSDADYIKVYYGGKLANAALNASLEDTPINYSTGAKDAVYKCTAYATCLSNSLFDKTSTYSDTPVALIKELSNKLNSMPSSVTSDTATGDALIAKVADALKDLEDVAWKQGIDMEDLAARAICSVCLGDPAWLAHSDSPLIKNVSLYSTEITTTVDGENTKEQKEYALVGTKIPYEAAEEDTKFNIFDCSTWGNAFNEVVYLNHCFLQKAHPAMDNTTTITGGGLAFLKVLAVVVLVIAIVAIVVVAVITTIFTGGAAAPAWAAAVVAVATKVAVVAVCVEVALLVGITVQSIDEYNSLTAQRDALTDYFDAVSEKTYGYEKVKAQRIAYGLGIDANSNVSDTNKTLGAQNPLIKDLMLAYGANKDNPNETARDATSAAAAICNAYVLDYTLYSPYGSLASSLGAVAQVQTQQGIVDDGKVYDKVGSFITVDVNLWGGIYYAYMIDIFGLTLDEDGVMHCAQLETNFPPIPEDLTAQTNPDLAALYNEGNELDTEAEREQKMDNLIDRMSEMTDVNATDYVGNWMTNTINSWILKTHASICGAAESGSIENIGGGTQYAGYSGYLATATLSEMPFTSWVMEYYNIIYMVLLILLIIIAVCMIVTGHRTVRKAIFSVLLMAVVLLLPKLTIDTVVSVSNTVAQDVYKDRFNFWAYAQYQQYISKLSDAEETNDEIEFLIVTNIQQATDYYSEDRGVTLKWMSPKKASYWDQLNGITGGSEDGLNLSIFKWMFQGQFKQESYSADGMATYLYRPFNDISMTARTFLQNRVDKISNLYYSNVLNTDVNADDTVCNRELNQYLTGLANASYINAASIDTDIFPSYIKRQSDDLTLDSPPSFTAAGSLSGKWYAYGVANSEANSVAFKKSSFITLSNSEDNIEDYIDVYPSLKADTVLLIDDVGIPTDLTAEDLSANLNLFYLYNESPYYYFYFMFQDMADRYAMDPETGKGSIRKLLLCENYFKYTADVNLGSTVATGYETKGNVSEGALMDYLDLQGLFTYVIPYLHQSNQYVVEWTDLWGMDPDKYDEEFNSELKGIWNMYSPWVDAMYETTYASGSMRVGGSKTYLNDAINPGSYVWETDGKDTRPMIFSEAQMQRNWGTEADLSEVEKRIQKTLKDTYTDLMYLNNYTTFDDDVLLSAMAMIATFNFNQNFSDNQLLGSNITLYPTGFEVKNFSYDSFLRLALLNTTGESVFSEEDIYTTVIQNSSFFTGLLILLNDLIAVYAIPAMKLVLLLGLFFLGLLICAGGFLSPPNNILKFVAKNFLLPLGIFTGILLGNTLIAALFVGEGMTSLVGQRGVTITTGDPTITILLMLAVNILVLWGFFKTLQLLLKSFKISLSWVGATAAGFITAAANKAVLAAKFGKNTAQAVGNAALAPVKSLAHTADNAMSSATGAKMGSGGGVSPNKRSGGKSSEDAPDARFKPDSSSDKSTSTSSSGSDGKTVPHVTEEHKKAMNNITSGKRDTLTRTRADGSSTEVIAGTTKAERKAARVADRMMTAEDRHAMKAFKQSEAKKWSEQSAARRQTKQLVKDTYGKEYNKASLDKKNMMDSIKQKRADTTSSYKTALSDAKAQLKGGKISKTEYKRLAQKAKAERDRSNKQWNAMSKSAKDKYRENTRAISEKTDAEVKKQLKDKGLMTQKHDTAYLSEYKTLMKDEHKARQKAINESKSRQIIERNSQGKVTSKRTTGRLADTNIGKKLNKTSTKVYQKAKTTANNVQKTVATKTKPVADAAKSNAKELKSRKRAFVANFKRNI